MNWHTKQISTNLTPPTQLFSHPPAAGDVIREKEEAFPAFFLFFFIFPHSWQSVRGERAGG